MYFLSTTYAAYQAAQFTAFTERSLVRAFRRWDAWAAMYKGQPVLVLDEYARGCVTVCAYTSLAERAADSAVLKTIPDSPPKPPTGGSGAPPVLWLPLPKRLN